MIVGMEPKVLSGLDVLQADGFAAVRGMKVGLVTHDAAIDAKYQRAERVFARTNQCKMQVVFGPEHGLRGTLQDLIPVGKEAGGAARTVSLYGDTFESLKPKREDLAGLDALVIDLVDVGSRYYTFQATMLYCMEAASELGIKVVVLDRPNPLGGQHVEGPTIQPGYESFVGPHPIATRHGMTMGELATLYKAERKLACPLEVVPCKNWIREQRFDRTGMPWVMPSPNMPTLATAVVYPGQCLIEGTSLSEGRGTTRPFELCGGELDPDIFADALNDINLPGVHFRPVTYRPTFQKFAGRDIGGVQFHVIDRDKFQPVRATLALLLVARWIKPFAWRTEKYEFVDHLPAIDILFGSDRERKAIDGCRNPLAEFPTIAAAWESEEAAFRKRRAPHLFYR